MTDWSDRLVAVADRDVRTLRRTRSYVLLAAVFVLVVVGLAAVGSTGGYVLVALTLLTPLELLVPTLAAVFGYRAVLGDRERGELTVLRTFPLSPEAYVGGVYLARAAAMGLTVVVALVLTMVLVPLASPATDVVAHHAGMDSPTLYLRFVVLTAAFAATMLAVLLALSAAVESPRTGLVVVVGTLIAATVGYDLVLVFGLGGVVSPTGLPVLLALSPTGAYRGLVLTLVVGPVTTEPVRAASPLASALSLLLWTVGSLVAATLLTWRESV